MFIKDMNKLTAELKAGGQNQFICTDKWDGWTQEDGADNKTEGKNIKVITRINVNLHKTKAAAEPSK